VSDEYSEPWPAEDEQTEVVRAYERASQLRPDDAQTHFDYGLAFMELGPGLEEHALRAFGSAVRLRPAWVQASGTLTLQRAGVMTPSASTAEPSSFHQET